MTVIAESLVVTKIHAAVLIASNPTMGDTFL